jgi:predicted ATPase
VTTTELRGRGDELQILSDALDASARGRGRVALLEGEAGIGKTRLLDELTERADALGVTVRRGAAEELEQGRPFGSLVDALGAPDGISLVTGHAGGDNRFFVQDAFVDHVERLAAEGPVLVAVDDAHWADRATLATLWALARRHADLGLLLVIAFRPTPRPDELARVIDGSSELDPIHLRLGPITDDALAALAADVVGPDVDPARLAALGGARGNPFVAIELLRTLGPADDAANPARLPNPGVRNSHVRCARACCAASPHG